MFSFIAIFLPSVVGIKLVDYLNKGLSFKNYIYYFSGLLVTSSIINILISYFCFGIKSNMVFCLNTLPVYFCKYCLVSIVINVLLSLLFVVIMKNLKFNVEVTDEKK